MPTAASPLVKSSYHSVLALEVGGWNRPSTLFLALEMVGRESTFHFHGVLGCSCTLEGGLLYMDNCLEYYLNGLSLYWYKVDDSSLVSHVQGCGDTEPFSMQTFRNLLLYMFGVCWVLSMDAHDCFVRWIVSPDMVF